MKNKKIKTKNKKSENEHEILKKKYLKTKNKKSGNENET